MTKTYEKWHPDEDRELLTLNGLQALVVDDDIDSLDLIAFILEEYGVQVLKAKSALQALNIIRQIKPDVLISDIAMPGEDGYELIRKIRNLSCTQIRQIPAIALTACLIEEGRILALESGFQIYLTKPVEPDELVVVVAKLVRSFLQKKLPWDRGSATTTVINFK